MKLNEYSGTYNSEVAKFNLKLNSDGTYLTWIVFRKINMPTKGIWTNWRYSMVILNFMIKKTKIIKSYLAK